MFLPFKKDKSMIKFMTMFFHYCSNMNKECSSSLNLSWEVFDRWQMYKLIIKSSFYIYILTRLKYLSWTSQFNLNTQVKHLNSTWYQSWVKSKLIDLTQFIKQSNIMSRELNIEIFPIFSPLHYLFDRKS